jgi:UDP-N-acetylmuramoylalanine--D-glutamate ligase
VDARFEGKRVHVIGLGSWGTGRAVALVLRKRGAEVTVSDVKSARELATEIRALSGMSIAIQTGSKAYRGIEDAELVVPSPGVPLTIPPLLRAKEHGAKVVSEVEVAYWIAPCPIIAVTGTKGKTTTTTLIGKLLEDEGKSAMVGGNIGRPLIELADTAGPDDLLVAEVSSFQLEATELFRPRVSVLLNLAPDHLDRHQDLRVYQEAKGRIFANQEPEDTAVINCDDAGAWGLRDRTRARVWGYTLAEGGSCAMECHADVADGWLRVAGERVCEVSALRLRGKHNRSNALASLLAARGAGATLEKAAATVERFKGVEHRLEEVAAVEGVLYVNDSQATTPDSAVAGIEAFEERVVLIAGGRPKVHDFSALGEAVARRDASLIVMGEAADEIAEAARAAGAKEVARAGDLDEAMRLAHEQARPGDVVLMSPACASFDMFASMAERGRKFKALVADLMAKEKL